MERLREEQISAIEETKRNIAQLEKFISDYECLGKQLQTLPHKVKHDIMVPFGKFAFMPGQLVHTNEIMVLLGDNWFVERSARQAEEIVGRRIKAIKEQIEGLDKQRGLLEPRLNFTTEVQEMEDNKTGVTEIKEEYDPDKEKVWREQHRKNVQSYRKQLQQERELQQRRGISPSESKQPCLTDEQVWARLDELQMQERAGNELKRLAAEDADEEKRSERFSSRDSVEDPRPHEKSVRGNDKDEDDRKKGKSVRWKDEDGGSSEEESGSSEDEGAQPATTITFCHTPVQLLEGAGTQEGTLQDTPQITSPSDIYRVFAPPPKSILKETVPGISPQVEAYTDQSLEECEPVSRSGPPAFMENIVERDVTGFVPEIRASGDAPVAMAVGDSAKPVSKFKASRQRGAQGEVVEPQSAGFREHLREVATSCVEDERLVDPPKKVSRFKAQKLSQQNR